MALSPCLSRLLVFLLFSVSLLGGSTARSLPSKRAPADAPAPPPVNTANLPRIPLQEYIDFLREYYPATDKYMLYTGRSIDQVEAFRHANPDYHSFEDMMNSVGPDGVDNRKHPWHQKWDDKKVQDDGDAASEAVSLTATDKITVFGAVEYQDDKAFEDSFFYTKEKDNIHNGVRDGRLKIINHMAIDALRPDQIAATEDANGKIDWKSPYKAGYKNASCQRNQRKRAAGACDDKPTLPPKTAESSAKETGKTTTKTTASETGKTTASKTTGKTTPKQTGTDASTPKPTGNNKPPPGGTNKPPPSGTNNSPPGGTDVPPPGRTNKPPPPPASSQRKPPPSPPTSSKKAPPPASNTSQKAPPPAPSTTSKKKPTPAPTTTSRKAPPVATTTSTSKKPIPPKPTSTTTKTTTTKPRPSTTSKAPPPPPSPSSPSPPAAPHPADVCGTWYKVLLDHFEIYGKDFDAAKFGDSDGSGLQKQIKGCGKLTKWSFTKLTNDPRGMQWVAKGNLPIGTKGCVGRAVVSAGGDSPDGCTGSG